ncbi:MAG TPA: hypothetical protein VHT92_12350 [Candidatus Cybelea sp.]|nr:hypothetical protein [Candidatus Cybelea sp.]
MRRVIGVVATAALQAVLCFAVTSAAELMPASGRSDLAAQLMLRLFGETSDSRASFAAAHGDLESESPLRELALQMPASAENPSFIAGDTAFQDDRLALSDLPSPELSEAAGAAAFGTSTSVVRFSPSVLPQAGDDVTAPTARFTAAYQAPTDPAVSPDPGTLAFAPPDTQHSPDFLTSTAQVGSVKFEGQGSTTQTPQLSLGDTSAGAGANFDVRAGKRSLGVNLSSEYEHVGRSDQSGFTVSPLDSASSWQLPGAGGAPLLVPSYANLNRLSLGAGLAVPVVRGLTLNLNYDAQHLYGGYGLPGLVNLDTINNSYGGKLTFNIPQISSSLSIGAYQDRFQDNLSLNGTSQTREDVNFTVKF